MKISYRVLILIIAGCLIMVIVGLGVLYRLPKKLKSNYFAKRWDELQKLLGDKAKWPDALINADKLLDEALKKRHYNGKSMGERLVAAQRDFQDNDSVWFGHKLVNKISSDPKIKLRKNEVKDALMGIKRALRDLGAFKND